MEKKTIINLSFQVLAKPEGDTAIVELFDDSENDFGQIILDGKDHLHLVMFGNENAIELSESQIKEAFEFARRNLFKVDYGACDENR